MKQLIGNPLTRKIVLKCSESPMKDVFAEINISMESLKNNNLVELEIASIIINRFYNKMKKSGQTHNNRKNNEY
jgi:hypothetical protein